MGDNAGLGVHKFWGFSPPVDLAKAVRESGDRGEQRFGTSKDVKVLCVGSGDVRHFLASLRAEFRKENGDLGPEESVEIFLLDAPVETMARHLLLLSILMDWEKSLRFRAHTFLEVYGNALVQEKTSTYISELSEQLISFLCDGEGPLKGFVDLSHLKFRDRDTLESTFKSWRDEVECTLKERRDERLRALHGPKFDHRDGQVDWDYHNGVKNQAGIINIAQYKHWHETGIAFEFGDEAYTKPNRSMSSYAEGRMNGVSKLKRGFWGDIRCGPYFTFGTETRPSGEALFERANKGLATEQYKKTAVHVSVFNILEILVAIERAEAYEMTDKSDIYSGISQPADRAEFVERRSSWLDTLRHRVRLSLISSDVLYRSKYKGYFDAVWLSNQQSKLVAEETFRNVLSEDCVIVCESVTNMVMLNIENKSLFDLKLRELMEQSGFIQMNETEQNKYFRKKKV